MLHRYDPIHFRSADLAPLLSARASDTPAGLSPSQVAKRDLARYYAQLARELSRLRLSQADARALVAVTQTWASSAETDPRGILYELEDADPGTVPPDLRDRLAAAGQMALLSVLDACERYWLEPSREADPLGALARVGLTREG